MYNIYTLSIVTSMILRSTFGVRVVLTQVLANICLDTNKVSRLLISMLKYTSLY